MPELPDVIPDETIEVEWGNAIRDRTVQRYDDETTRTSEHGSPTAGDLAYMEDSGDVLVYHSGAWQPFLPAGAVIPYAGSSAPTGWLFCHGQAVSRSTYARLFDIVGTAYGDGDGSTTFNLPDLRQRFPLGKAASGEGDALGDTGGALSQTLTTSHLPSHNHSGPSHTHGDGSLATSGGSHAHGSGTLSAGSGGGNDGLVQGRAAPATSTAHGHPGSGGKVAAASGAGGTDVNFTAVIGTHDDHAISGNTATSSSHSHTISGNTGSGGTGNTGNAGSGNSFSKMPPYVVLNHVIKT